jgi:hypothetical protein
MKKNIFYAFGFLILIGSFASCKSAKGGCGLTSDAQKIEQTSEMNQTSIVTEE